MKILHVSDIHMDAGDRDYCLAILDSLLNAAADEKVAALCICGDLFHTKSDILNESFRETIIEKLSGFSQVSKVFYIPGNHEDREGDFGFMEAFDWKKVHFMPKVEICILQDKEEVAEIVGIPHSRDYSALFRGWNPKPKSRNPRLALAHGAIPGFEFLGDEDEAGILTSTIFERLQTDAVLLGHIHKYIEKTIDNCSYVYPGSLRPLRSTETGPRKFNLVSISNNSIKCIPREFPASGRIRSHSISLFEPDWQDFSPEDLKQNDHLIINLEGLVETGTELDQGCSGIEQKLAGKVRKIEIKTDNCTITSNILKNEFIARTHKRWLEAKPQNGDDREIRIWQMSFGLLYKYVKNYL